MACESEVIGGSYCSTTRTVLFIGAGHANHATVEVSEHSSYGNRVTAAL